MSVKHLLVATSAFALGLGTVGLGTAAFAQSNSSAPGSYSSGPSGSPNGAAAQSSNPGGMNSSDMSHGSGAGSSSMSNGSGANGGPMASSTAPASTHTMHHHARHSASSGNVKQAQTALQSQGLYQGQVDGKWGPKTHAAVMAYQKQNNIKQSGRLDHATLASLNGGGSSMSGNAASGNAASMGGSQQRPGQSMSNAGGRAGAPSGSTLVPPQSGAAPKTNPGPTSPAN